MKTKETTQEPQKSTIQRLEQASNSEVIATISDNRPDVIHQRKIKESMGNITASNLIIQKKNNTGLPDNLKSGIESLSGYSMDDVKVHYNSSKPAQLQAHAYAQGTDIHLAQGQEKHLPHEAWHVVQQKQGRVKPTRQLKSKVAINDDFGLEREADLMGAKALQLKTIFGNSKLVQKNTFGKTIQRQVDYDNLRKEEGNQLLIKAVEIFFHFDDKEDLMDGEAIDILFPNLIKESFANRLSNTDNTQLILGVETFLGTKNQALAETNLKGYKRGGDVLTYDDDTNSFLKSLGNKEIEKFEIEVMFNRGKVNMEGSRFYDKPLGYLLQTVTHELTVHAENMINMIRLYWDYYNDNTAVPPNLALKTASQEHLDFTTGNVDRYEFIKFLLFSNQPLTTSPLDPAAFGVKLLSNDFNEREKSDKVSST